MIFSWSPLDNSTNFFNTAKQKHLTGAVMCVFTLSTKIESTLSTRIKAEQNIKPLDLDLWLK